MTAKKSTTAGKGTEADRDVELDNTATKEGATQDQTSKVNLTANAQNPQTSPEDRPAQDAAKYPDAPSAELTVDEQKELGKAAYQAYGEQVGGIDTTGTYLTAWEELGETRQKAWVAAALVGYNAP